MAASDSTATTLITAAAGLVGALIGGLSTYAANRGQWRRESRRTVYASLISASYEMESVIRSGLDGTKEVKTETTADKDPLVQFRLQLDTATLLAKRDTRTALDEWRYQVDEMGDKPARFSQGDLDKWQLRRNAFYVYARDELGAPGMVRYRKRAVWYASAAIPTIALFAWLAPRTGVAVFGLEIGLDWLQRAEHVFYGITFALLFFAFGAAARWRRTLISSNRERDERKASQWLLFAILLAFLSSLCSLAVFLYGHTSAPLGFGFIAILFLSLGLFRVYGATETPPSKS